MNKLIPYYSITFSILNTNEESLKMFQDFLSVKVSEFILELNLSGVECEAKITYHNRMKLQETYQVNFYSKL